MSAAVDSVLVVGASLSGLSTARALRTEGFEGAVTLVGREPHRPYDRPPLSKDFLSGALPESDLLLEEPAEDLGVRWVLGTDAVALDPRAGEVVLEDGRRLGADRVVVATGARARTLPGADGLAGIHTLRTIDDARALRDDLARGGPLVVVGAGFVGAEVASTARNLGVDVTVVEAQPTPLAGPLGSEMGEVVSALHADHGTTLRCGVGVDRFTGTDRVDGVVLGDGRYLPADTVLVAVGASAEVGWLASSGIETGAGIPCSTQGWTSNPYVLAVGDCAAWYDPVVGTHRRIEHWTNALEQPTVVARALLGGDPTEQPRRRPPYFWSDQYGVTIQFAGHAGRADTVRVVEGDPAARSFLAVYEQGGLLRGVLGMNQPRLFSRWRRWIGHLTGTEAVA